MTRHVTILGLGSTPRSLPPGEVWLPNFMPRTPYLRARLTRAFQIHPIKTLNNREHDWLRVCGVPIYTIRKTRHPMSRQYPFDAVRRAVGDGPYASSFDYMLALALTEGFKAITLHGVTLQRGTLRERLLEHVSLAYWVGLARGRGIRVTIARDSFALYFPWAYGVDYWRERRFGQQMASDALACEQLDDGNARPNPTVRGVRMDGRR